MRVKDILASKKSKGTPLGVGKDAVVADVIKVMVEHDTGSCLVLDGDRLLGLVTFREIIQRLHEDPASCTGKAVSEVMDSDPEIATPADTLDQLRAVMTTKHIRYLPVMDEGRLVDVVSFYDVAVALAKKSDFENRMLKQYISDWPEDGS